MNNIIFESGQYYTLSQIFTSGNKIIIPDLQRDYCWGNNVWNEQGKKESELVSGFVDNLFELNKSNTNQTLGLVYGYESPKHHIQLCDGQQRITTLFLLMGMINRRTSNNKFQKYLISNEELTKDDKEPYLQYGIRESTLYFLSDLVCHYFIDKNNNESIEKQEWYFEEYNLDASIQSMLAAIKLIDAKLDEKANHVDFCSFGDFILNKLQMIYYDMGNRTRGEETFVVINTTGEPLTATENLKPILLGKISDREDLIKKSDEWEKREEWFWNNRIGAGHKKNIVADNGVREFFRWVSILLLNENPKDFKIELNRIRETTNFKFIDKNLDLYKIHRYFEIVQFLFNEKGVFKNNFDWLSPDESDNYINTQIVWFRLLPVIEYINRYGLDIEERKIIRVKMFFQNLSRLENVQKNAGELLLEAIRIIKELPNDDIVSVLNLGNVSVQILREEEKMKFELYTNNNYDRNDLEDRFWNAEEHIIWDGEIRPLIKWSEIEGRFNIEQFDKFNSIFNTLFDSNCKYTDLDLVRRALLTKDLDKYPNQFKGYTNLSFCYEPSDWKILIGDNIEKFGKFLDEVNSDDYQSVLNQMIDINPCDKDFDEFVKIPELLAYCHQKNIQWAGDKLGWILVRNEKTSGEHANLKAYRLFLDLKTQNFWNAEWSEIDFYNYDESCVCLNNTNNITIDIKYFGVDLYYIELFRKNNIDPDDYKNQLDFFAKKFNLLWNEQVKRFVSDTLCKQNLIILLRTMLNDTEYFKIEI